MEPGDSAAPADRPSLTDAAAALGGRAVGLVGTRLELAAVEIAEARVRLVRGLVLVGAALGCGLITLMLVTLGVLAWFWDTDRFAAIIVLTLAYAAAAVVLWYRYEALGRAAPAVFAATIAALRADAALLQGKPEERAP